MSKRLRFIWIDDDPQRELESRNIAERLNISLDFVNLQKQNLVSKLKEIV